MPTLYQLSEMSILLLTLSELAIKFIPVSFVTRILKGIDMRSLLLLSVFSLNLLGGFRAPEKLGVTGVANMTSGFAILKDGKLNHIESDCLDTMLRKMNFEQRNQYLLKGGSFEVNQSNTGEYTLKAVANLKGGGLVGAWLGSVVGYGLVTGLGHGAIHLIAICTGPAYPVTAATLTKMCAIPIHAAATKAGIAAGIAAGVATGPV